MTPWWNKLAPDEQATVNAQAVNDARVALFLTHAKTGDATADTQRIHAEFERVIREYPDQWLWIHRRWKTRPPGEAPLD